jgi:hypothetical protein
MHINKLRFVLVLATILFVGTTGFLGSLYARGYRFNFKSLVFEPRGILVVKSDPTGAQILVNGNQKAISDASVNLVPGVYDVEVKRDGFLTWSKRLTIEKEVVTQVMPFLFKSAPSLSPVTFSGCVNPVASADFTKIAFLINPTNGNNREKTGLWLLETVNFPLGFSKDARQITDGSLEGATFVFSPTGREILLTSKQGVYLLDTGSFTTQNQRVNVSSRKAEILKGWEKEKKTKLEAQIKTLPSDLADILSRKAKTVIFSPDDTKIMYEASGSATLKEGLVKALPGSSTQKQDRDIKPGNIYIYDIKEDRNFFIGESSYDLALGSENTENTQRRLAWFPTSKHLVYAEYGKITVMDYDSTNHQMVFTGSYISPAAFPFGSTEKLLILTNLGGETENQNLYSLSLK